MKIFTVFSLVLILNRLRIRLSLSLFIGSLILGLWMGLGPGDWIKSALISITSLQSIGLVLIVGLIMVVSRIMKESGHLDRLVESFTRLSRDARTVGAVMAALIGLLPMPGGVLFSSPMVETSLKNHSISSEQKAILNYWFRHIWEYWWPLYPGVVLAITLLEVKTWQFMAIMFPMTLPSILAGVIFILKPIGKIEGNQVRNLTWPGIKEFLWEAMPILIVILVIILEACLTGVMGLLGFHIEIPGAISILPGLVVSIIWVCFVNHIFLKQFRSAFTDRNILPILLLILAIMLFKGIMIESQAVIQIRNELVAYRIPVVLVVLIVPFLSGLITGIGIGFVGTSFPLIIPLFQTNHFFEYMSFVLLAFTFGHMGVMLSPVHFCLLVTKDYFNASLLGSYRHLIMPVLMVILTALCLFFLMRAF